MNEPVGKEDSGGKESLLTSRRDTGGGAQCLRDCSRRVSLRATGDLQFEHTKKRERGKDSPPVAVLLIGKKWIDLWVKKGKLKFTDFFCKKNQTNHSSAF